MHNFLDIDRNKLSNFLNTISPWKAAYSEATLSLIGLKRGEEIEILRANMVLLCDESFSTEVVVETQSLIACRVVLKDINESYDAALEKLATSGLPTPFGTIRITLTERENSPSCHFSSNGPISGKIGRRSNYLSIRGARRDATPALDIVTWELMAAKRPYGSLSELADDLSIPRFTLEDVSFVEAHADAVLTIDKGKHVCGTEALLGVVLARGLESAHCSLGYVVGVAGSAIDRGRIDGTAMEWKEIGTSRFGEFRLSVPKGASVRVYASYNGNPQDADQLFDPTIFPNYRHALHDVFDADLVILKRYLFDEKNQQKNARDLEVGVAILFFMLGFSVNSFVGKPLEDAPDMIACAKGGDMLLIECTTSLINREGKLAKLVDRVAMVNARLRNGPETNVRVLPMVISTKTSESVAATDRQAAEEQGIVIWTRENLETALDQARFPHDSDEFFERYWVSCVQGRVNYMDPLQQVINLPPP